MANPRAEPAGMQDIPLIRELCFAVWPQTYRHILSEEQIGYMLELMYSEASLQKQMKDGALFFLVYDQDKPTGFASIESMGTQIWKLNKLYILPSQQGKGTGKFLLEYLQAFVMNQGASFMQLQVNRNNPARKFYEKLGYAIVKEADFDIGNGYFMEDYVMEKEL